MKQISINYKYQIRLLCDQQYLHLYIGRLHQLLAYSKVYSEGKLIKNVNLNLNFSVIIVQHNFTKQNGGQTMKLR